MNIYKRIINCLIPIKTNLIKGKISFEHSFQGIKGCIYMH